jgi:hypothetical protein
MKNCVQIFKFDSIITEIFNHEYWKFALCTIRKLAFCMGIHKFQFFSFLKFAFSWKIQKHVFAYFVCTTRIWRKIDEKIFMQAAHCKYPENFNQIGVPNLRITRLPMGPWYPRRDKRVNKQFSFIHSFVCQYPIRIF